MATMRDVAHHAGVSAKTVSRVFNEDPHVAEETRLRVRQAMHELDYVPNMLAKTFRAGRDDVVGIAVPDIAHPFFAELIAAAVRVADTRNLAVMATGHGDDPERERHHLEALLRRQLLGLIAVPASSDHAYLRTWQKRTPMVFVDRVPNNINADSLVEDDHGGAYTATSHLIAHGHRRVAFLGDNLDLPTTRHRLDGYQQALADGGIEAEPGLVRLGAVASEDAARILTELMSGSRPPTALLSTNPRCSAGVVPTLQRMRRTDVALVGVGDFPMADALQPAVTVIDQDPGRLGRMAVERLLERHEDPKRRVRKTVLPLKLIVRGSGELPCTEEQ